MVRLEMTKEVDVSKERNEPRFDVYFEGSDRRLPSIDYHHCRDWKPNPETGELEGCYGTNPHHGMSFDEAVMSVVNFLREEITWWCRLTLKDWEEQQEGQYMSWDEYMGESGNA